MTPPRKLSPFIFATPGLYTALLGATLALMAYLLLPGSTYHEPLAPRNATATPPTISLVLFALASIALFVDIVVHVSRALGEREPHKEAPEECAIDPAPLVYVFSFRGETQTIIQRSIVMLERHFSRYYFFHTFRPPYLCFAYQARTSAASLFALPWIKTGLLFLLLFCSIEGIFSNSRSPDQASILFLSMAVAFWLPGFLLLWGRPYRKLWVQLLDHEGRVQVRLTCASPFRLSKRATLCKAIEGSLRDA